MKFNKTVAIALATRTRDLLDRKRSQAIKEYQIPEKQLKTVKEAINTYIEAQETLNTVSKYLQEISKTSFYGIQTRESMLEEVRVCMAKLNTPFPPSTETLINDFIIESIDATSAEELINKITSKYSIK